MKLYTENFTIILNKHITNTEIDTYEFRVLCYLLMLSDDDGICFPSYNTIAEKIGIGETKAKNAIKHLIELGIIKKTNRTKEDGSAGSNLYVVCEKTTMQVAEKPDKVVSSTTSCVADDLPHGCEMNEGCVQDDHNKYSNINNKYFINSEDGEFVATGWERERQVYFEILQNPGYRGNEAEQSDERFRETSVEVPGDIGRSGNLILDVGVGTLTALASLMDNDQDDDPEEKKKKLDAKDAGSNFGFALGGAIGLAATLIAKNRKQDEDITETPTEEPDELDEINNEPYEESEDLDEDEGFKLEM